MLFNHLFGRKSIAKELAMDADKRMALWQQHLANHLQRESLSRHFSFRNIDKAMQEFDATAGVLRQIASLISPELISIAGEEKLDKEIIADLDKLKSTGEIEGLSHTFVYEKRKQEALLAIFQEIHDILKAELHLISLIMKKPPNARDLLLKLFELIYHREAMLYMLFKEESFHDKSVHARLSKIARAAILQEELEEEIEAKSERFARKIVTKMTPGEPMRKYRELGREIFLELARMAGAPLSRGEMITEGVIKLEALMKDDALLSRIIRKLKPKYSEIMVKVIIPAFRQAYNRGHFDEFAAEFAT